MVRSFASQSNGGFLGAQAARLGLRLQFERNRDPLYARQLDDLQKTEAERRESGSVTPSRYTADHRRNDKPAPALKPPPHMRHGIQGPSPMGTASHPPPDDLNAQRDAAFARVPKADPSNVAPSQEVHRDLSVTYNRVTPSQSI